MFTQNVFPINIVGAVRQRHGVETKGNLRSIQSVGRQNIARFKGKAIGAQIDYGCRRSQQDTKGQGSPFVVKSY